MPHQSRPIAIGRDDFCRLLFRLSQVYYKLAINIGVWTINDGYKHECGVYVDEVKFDYLRTKEQFQSNVNGNKLLFKDKKQLWASRIDHVSGERQYASQEELYPMEYPKIQSQMK